jgi:hypothetical protein
METMKKETSTVSFRLDSHYIGKLQRQAEKHGISIHEQARRALIDDLDDKRGEEILEQLSALKGEMTKIQSLEKSVVDLRADLAEAVDWIVKRLSSQK